MGMVEFGLITTLVFWWVVGLAGCRLAEEGGLPRLVGAVVLAWIVVTVGLSPSVPGDLYVSSQRVDAFGALEGFRRKTEADVTALKATGVTGIAVAEFRAQADRQAADQEKALAGLAARDRRTFGLAVIFPVVVVALVVVLVSAPWTSAPFLRRLPFMAAAFVSAALGAAVVGVVLLWSGWVTLEGVSWQWVVALSASAAVTSMPVQSGFKDALWESGFEPLLYALAGASVALFVDFDWLLVLLVLVAFIDCKAIGAVLLDRFVARRGWAAALGRSLALVRGSPAGLAVALCFGACGWLDGAGLTALVIAHVVASGVVEPMRLALAAGGSLRGIHEQSSLASARG